MKTQRIDNRRRGKAMPSPACTICLMTKALLGASGHLPTVLGAVGLRLFFHSHSIVPGGLDVQSSTTLLTSGTEFVMRVEMRARTS